MKLRMTLCTIALIVTTVACDFETEPLVDQTSVESTVAPSSALLVELHTWYSPSRNEYHTTGSSGWRGAPGATRSPDYRWVRIEGRVWRPDMAQPADTVPLHHWWRSSSLDNLLIAGTDIDWWLEAVGFTHVQLEGYAPRNPVAGTIGLDFYYGADYLVTADPMWDSSGHTFWRNQGYIFKPGYWEPPTPDPELFGYRRLAITGSRPLLVIVRNDLPSRAGTTNGPAFYRQFVFGPGSRTIPGFFSANSYGNFTFTDGGVFNAFTSNDSDFAAIRAAGFAGANFDAFDRNLDGRVTSDELAVVVINKFNDSCGQTRGVTCTRPPGSSVDVCLGSASFVGERVSFTTIAHELAHQLQMWHTYGPGAAWNFQATTGAATCFSNNDPRSFQMDPWHKMAWGWILPRIISVDEPPTVESLYSPAAFGNYGYYGKRPVILFDPDRGTREFFMLEARERDGLYDAQVADSGMAAWLVNLSDDYVPDDVFFQADTDPALEHIFGIRLFHGPNSAGSTGPRAGFGRFFRDGDGALGLRWGNGASVGKTVEFEFTDSSRRVGQVQIGGDDVFRARIDATSISTTAGATITVSGVFGHDGPRTAYLYDGGSSPVTALTSTRWDPEGIARLEIPVTLAPGDYELVIHASSSLPSNSVPVHVD